MKQWCRREIDVIAGDVVIHRRVRLEGSQSHAFGLCSASRAKEDRQISSTIVRQPTKCFILVRNALERVVSIFQLTRISSVHRTTTQDETVRLICAQTLVRRSLFSSKDVFG